MPVCLELDDVQKAALASQGWTFDGGHDTEEACRVACETGTGSTGTGSGTGEDTLWYCLLPSGEVEPICVELTLLGLAALLFAGYEQLSVGFPTQVECEEQCVGSGSTGTGSTGTGSTGTGSAGTGSGSGSDDTGCPDVSGVTEGYLRITTSQGDYDYNLAGGPTWSYAVNVNCIQEGIVVENTGGVNVICTGSGWTCEFQLSDGAFNSCDVTVPGTIISLSPLLVEFTVPTATPQPGDETDCCDGESGITVLFSYQAF